MHGEVVGKAVDILNQLIAIDPWTALGVVLLGFMGGVLSGFIGSGGAFIMTPGMMNLGVPGIVAVASNITHKFGKAMMGQKKHGEFGHVDRKLGVILVATAFIGIKTAVYVNSWFFEVLGKAGSNLYVSLFFVGFLSIISLSMILDVIRGRKMEKSGIKAEPSKKLYNFFQRFQIRPLIYFKVAKVRISIWVMLGVGFLTGYLAGTIGVGGFVGVPAMIYVFGVPTAVAAGTELFLAMFMGAFGALNYALGGYVDIRLTMLLYLGSLMGLMIGAVGTKIVQEIYIRMVTGVLIMLCVISRAVAVPKYLAKLEYITLSPAQIELCELISRIFLFGSGVVATSTILFVVFRAYFRKRATHYAIPRLVPEMQKARA